MKVFGWNWWKKMKKVDEKMDGNFGWKNWMKLDYNRWQKWMTWVGENRWRIREGIEEMDAFNWKGFRV